MSKIRIAVIALILGLIAALIGTVSMTGANADTGTPGDSADNPIVVDSLDEIPAEAALSAVLNEDCSTTTTGVLTVPGNEETSHEEFRYLREVPGQDEVSHVEYLYEKTVVDYKTQYHFRKFTHTKYKSEGTWGDYGPWTPWVPETHTSWEDSDAPLGVPQFHGQGDNWYREWQAMFDGQTRQVENGSHQESSGWVTEQLGEPWVLVDTRKVVDSEAVPGYTEYYVLGGEPSLNEADASWILAEQAPEGWTQFDERTVSNEDGTDPVTTYYEYNDGVKCDTPEEPPTNTPPVKHNNPPAPKNPGVPTLIDAGL